MTRNNSSTAFRKLAAWVVARDGGLCGLCGHGDARTVDHVISVRDWPEGVHGVHEPENLQAAHGSRGVGVSNPCPVCGKLCNQSKGAGHGREPGEIHSRVW